MQSPGKEIAPPVEDLWMSIPSAAKALGVSNSTVPAMALRGELRSMVAAGRTLIERTSVEQAIARRADAAAGEE